MNQRDSEQRAALESLLGELPDELRVSQDTCMRLANLVGRLSADQEKHRRLSTAQSVLKQWLRTPLVMQDSKAYAMASALLEVVNAALGQFDTAHLHHKILMVLPPAAADSMSIHELSATIGVCEGDIREKLQELWEAKQVWPIDKGARWHLSDAGETFQERLKQHYSINAK